MLFRALRCYWVEGWLRIFYNYARARICSEVGVQLRHCRLGETVIKAIRQLWSEESGQDVAEYAVMLAVILVIVIGTVKLIGTNANNVFSQVSSQMTN